MAKYQIDEMLDEALTYIKTKATKVCVCTASIDSSITYAKATNDPSTSSGTCLAKSSGSTLASSISSITNGVSSGRKITIPQKTDLTVLGSGANTAARLVVVGTDNSSANAVLFITDTTGQSLTAGNLVTTPAFNIELSDAA